MSMTQSEIYAQCYAYERQRWAAAMAEVRCTIQEHEMSDIRQTSYDALTANAVGYQGTIDEALEQIRAEDDIPPKPITARQELLGFLGVNRTQMSGIEVPSGAAVLRRVAFKPEDDSVEYGFDHVTDQVSIWSLEYAYSRGWIPQA